MNDRDQIFERLEALGETLQDMGERMGRMDTKLDQLEQWAEQLAQFVNATARDINDAREHLEIVGTLMDTNARRAIEEGRHLKRRDDPLVVYLTERQRRAG